MPFVIFNRLYTFYKRDILHNTFDKTQFEQKLIIYILDVLITSIRLKSQYFGPSVLRCTFLISDNSILILYPIDMNFAFYFMLCVCLNVYEYCLKIIISFSSLFQREFPMHRDNNTHRGSEVM